MAVLWPVRLQQLPFAAAAMSRVARCLLCVSAWAARAAPPVGAGCKWAKVADPGSEARTLITRLSV